MFYILVAMKKYPILVFLFLVSLAGAAQDTTVTWLNGYDQSVDFGLATLERHSWKENDSLWQVRDYFLDGVLQMSGTYADADLDVKHGRFSFFAENGTKTSEGTYDHNVNEGFWNSWYDTGVLMDHGKYLGDITDAERDSIWNSLLEMKDIRFHLRESLKDSTWEYFHENGVRSGLEEYEFGMLTESQYWNADGSEVAPDAVVNRFPEYPGGDKELMRFLTKNIKYPKGAKRMGIQGTVYTSFQVDKDGKIKNLGIYKSVSPGLDAEALRVLQSMPRWNPGMTQNRFIDVQYRLPIRFSLR